MGVVAELLPDTVVAVEVVVVIVVVVEELQLFDEVAVPIEPGVGVVAVGGVAVPLVALPPGVELPPESG